MSLLFVLFGILILLLLIVKKLDPMLALLISAIATGIMLNMPLTKIITSISSGVGSTLSGIIMILALGAMIGKLTEDSGASKKIVHVLLKVFGIKNIQWAMLLTGILVGIPLFFNAGFVVLVPLVFTIASATKLPKLYVGMPLISALSITHGFLPPHPGPVALSSIFNASIGKVLLYGMTIAIPTALVAGIIFPRLSVRITESLQVKPVIEHDGKGPSTFKSFLMVLMPIVLIGIGNLGILFLPPALSACARVVSDPTIALLLTLIIILIMIDMPLTEAMKSSTDGVKNTAMIIMIIAAGGAFKQILIDSGVGEQVKLIAVSWHISPLVLGWLIAALLRITLGSSTVASLTGAGMVVPLVKAGAPAELMVLAVGSGSLMLSHFNDTGFWMFKEYFGLTVKQTFKTWTAMECIISVMGLIGVLVLNAVL